MKPDDLFLKTLELFLRILRLFVISRLVIVKPKVQQLQYLKNV